MATQGLTKDQIRALPISVPLADAGRALLMDRNKSHELARMGRFPCRVLRTGSTYIVPKADLLRLLTTGIRVTAATGDVTADMLAYVLRQVARHVSPPMNASLPEALRAVTRNEQLAEQAVQRIASTLRLHPRDLPLWDVTRTRNQVADVLRLAAGDPPVTSGARYAVAMHLTDGGQR